MNLCSNLGGGGGAGGFFGGTSGIPGGGGAFRIQKIVEEVEEG
jgi:hypothetical protein